jgi:hypothetical protein
VLRVYSNRGDDFGTGELSSCAHWSVYVSSTEFRIGEGSVPGIYTTGIEAFTESEFPLAEWVFPLTEGFTERKLSVKASRPNSTGEGAFAESTWDPSRRVCAEGCN